MNRLTIIGNLTRAPESRITSNGTPVCSFTVAVNKRTQKDHPEADYFRVTAWNQIGENCAKYLDKGRKVCVIGPVSVSTYQASDGSTRASMDITANDVEFLSRASDDQSEQKQEPTKATFVEVETDELPF